MAIHISFQCPTYHPSRMVIYFADETLHKYTQCKLGEVTPEKFVLQLIADEITNYEAVNIRQLENIPSPFAVLNMRRWFGIEVSRTTQFNHNNYEINIENDVAFVTVYIRKSLQTFFKEESTITNARVNPFTVEPITHEPITHEPTIPVTNNITYVDMPERSFDIMLKKDMANITEYSIGDGFIYRKLQT